MVMEAVMILKKVEPTWTEAKRQLGDVEFLNKVGFFLEGNAIALMSTFETYDFSSCYSCEILTKIIYQIEF